MTPNSAKVFVVDDDAVRKSLQMLFKTEGVKTELFSSDDEFLHAFDSDWQGMRHTAHSDAGNKRSGSAEGSTGTWQYPAHHLHHRARGMEKMGARSLAKLVRMSLAMGQKQGSQPAQLCCRHKKAGANAGFFLSY